MLLITLEMSQLKWFYFLNKPNTSFNFNNSSTGLMVFILIPELSLGKSSNDGH